MSSQQSGIQGLQRAAAAALHEHWVLFLVEGVVLLVLGATAVVLPPIATLAVTILLGWLFLVSGIIGLFTTYWLRHAPGFWWSLLSAVLGIVVGAMLLASPLTGAFSLTLVLVAFFLVEGAASIMFALDHRRELSGQWGWMLASGIIDLALAIMIFAGLPSTAAKPPHPRPLSPEYGGEGRNAGPARRSGNVAPLAPLSPASGERGRGRGGLGRAIFESGAPAFEASVMPDGLFASRIPVRAVASGSSW